MSDGINGGSTTLVTFLYENLQARSVDLLGSWDNFTKPYPMKLDTRRGGDQWTGCYTFDDIAFDGDEVVAGGVRSGGLKMGGTYWYYYSIDGGLTETYDESEPHSTQCPLLPGQCVNVLDVPMEGPPTSRRDSTSSIAAMPTLDPQDRYINPRPAPTPKRSVPCLATAASDDVSLFALSLRRHRRPQQPATAAADSYDCFGRPAAGVPKQVRTPATSSTSTVKSAFAFLKGPSATDALGHSRSRSRTWPIKDRIKLLQTSRNPSQEGSPSQGPPASAPARIHGHVVDAAHKRNASDSPIPSPRLASGSFHTRSVSANDASDESTYNRAYRDPYGRRPFPPRSSSKRQGVVATETSEGYLDYASLEESDVDSERPPVVLSSSVDVFIDPQAEEGLGESVASSLILDKELPPLPTYLIPDPLNVLDKSDEHQTQDRSPILAEPSQNYTMQSRFSEWTIKQSRFSEWTAYSADNEEALDFEDDDDDDVYGDTSPTFSSVLGESLDAMTPRFLSVHASPSVDEQLSLFPASHWDQQDADDTPRPDLDALQQLRDAINSSGLASHNTFEPMGAAPYMASARGSSLELDTVTTASSKLHGVISTTSEPLVAGESSFMAELMSEFDYLGVVLS